jgi:hypothetical protein
MGKASVNKYTEKKPPYGAFGPYTLLTPRGRFPLGVFVKKTEKWHVFRTKVHVFRTKVLLYGLITVQKFSVRRKKRGAS